MGRVHSYRHTVVVGNDTSLSRLGNLPQAGQSVELVDSLEAALEIQKTRPDVELVIDPAFLKDSGVSLLPDDQPGTYDDHGEHDFQKLFQAMGEAFVMCEMIWDETGAPVDFRYLMVNSAWETHTGIPVNRTIGRTAREIVPGIEQWWIDTAARVVRTGEPVRDEHYAGDIGKWLEVYVFRYSENRFASVFTDVTERKAQEDLLTRSEDMFSKAFRLSPQIVVISRLSDGRYIDVNDAFADTLGYSREEAIGRTSTELGVWLDPSERERFVSALREQGTLHNVEAQFRAKSGKVISTLFSADVIHIRGEECLLAVAVDVSERAATEKALRENQALLQSIIDNMPAAVYVKDVDGKLIVANKTLADLLGLSREWLIGKTSYDVYPPEVADEHVANDRQVLETGQAFEAEEIVPQEDEVRTFLTQKFPLKHEDGSMYALGGISTEITGRKRAEHSLHKTNIRLKLVSDTASQLLVTEVPEDAITHLAHKAMEYLDCQVFLNYLVDESGVGLRLHACAGLDDEDCRRLHWIEFGSTVCGTVAQGCQGRVIEDVQNSLMPETRLIRSLGVNAYACMPLRSHKGRLIGTFSFGSKTKSTFTEDDTSVMRILADNVAIAFERKLAEQELRDKEERLRLATESGQVGIWSLDLVTGEVVWDDYLRSLFGVSQDTRINYDLFRSMVHPEDAERVAQGVAIAVDCGSAYQDEFRLIRSDGSLRWTASRGSVICDESGRPVRLLGAATDITQRKHAEQEIARAHAEAERRAGEIESLVANMPDGLSIFDAAGHLIFMNDAGRAILGIGSDDKMLSWPEQMKATTVNGDPMDSEEMATVRALRGEVVRDTLYRLDYRGRQITISISASPVKDSHGNIIGATNTFRDVTERVEFEQQREELFEREHNIAQVLQQALIPSEVPLQVDGYRMAVRYEPALREAEVGGDFYDIFDIGGGRFGVLIGDVVGKGLGAAISVAAARYTVKGYAYLNPSPNWVLTLTNNSLCREGSDESGMLTAFLAIIDTNNGTITYSSAGHEPPVVIDGEGETSELDIGGIPLGVMSDFNFSESSRSIRPGERIVMVTDGITEARAAGAHLFHKEGILRILTSNRTAAPDELAQRILDAARAHAEGQLQDDAAIVVVERTAHSGTG